MNTIANTVLVSNYAGVAMNSDHAINTTTLSHYKIRYLTMLYAFVMGAVVLFALAFPVSAVAAFCDSQTDPAVVYCEDFSESNPLGSYTVTNPYNASTPFTFVGVSNEALEFINNLAGLASAQVNYNTPIDFQDTSLEADVRFNTLNPGLRLLVGIQLIAGPVSQGFQNRIVWSLQLDEKNAVLNVNIPNGLQIKENRSFPVLMPNKTYHLRLEVVGNTRVKGYVDGVLLLDEPYNLSLLPPLLTPGFIGNSYGYAPETQVYDNAIARHIFTLSCIGFESPLDEGLVTMKKNRVLPFKAKLADKNGTSITNMQLGDAPPVINVNFDPGTGGTPIDVTDLAIPAGLGTPGNQFVFADGKWQFNLQTKNYVAPGNYRVIMTSGGSYLIDPACSSSFVIK